ncbi:hypothetical protein V1264_005552 [Littorina saxatilis]|uniref:Receptor protein-tyrosine kinase n=2 Tax=Littorina saxatilis TaxID=31220 RepID=A0AAN9B1T2_9CAEN
MGRNHFLASLFLLLSALAIASVFSQDHVCSRRAVRYRPRRVCRHWWWWSCCSWRYYSEAYYINERVCCPGWKSSDTRNPLLCDTPICAPGCQNGGTCVSPGKCDCTAGYTGFRCDGALCSHERPCYPGTCQPGGGCDCLSGFTSPSSNQQDYCLKIEESKYFQPEIHEMQVRLSYWANFRSPPLKLHEFLADSTGLDTSTDGPDFIWTNRGDFNRLETSCSSQFIPPEITGKPDYIRGSALGIVTGSMVVYLRKLRAGGTFTDFLSLNKTIPCAQSVSSDQPETGIFNCSITDSFDRILEHRDVLEINFNTTAGGFRDVVNTDNPSRLYIKQHFIGVTKAKAVEFRFDFLWPYHCTDTGNNCDPKSMLNVPDMTKTARIAISWGNWADEDSGLFRFAWEVFKMTKAAGTELEIRPALALKPLINQEVFNSNYSIQHFTLREPGMYSVILELGDQANNTRYVRRLVLYDPTPVITADPVHAFFVTSASMAANYTFQNNISAPITVTWEGHFRNAFHEDNNLLGQVRAYPPELRDLTVKNKYIFRKVILRNTSDDDNEGSRTVEEIPNRRGIVNFKIQDTTDTDGGKNQPATPTGTWTDLDLSTHYTVRHNPSDKQTVTIWVQATDAMGTELVERRQVSFDSSAPNASSLQFLMNAPVPGIDFSSTFAVDTVDRESGVAYVLWTFRRNSTGQVIHQEKVPGKQVSSCNGLDRNCYNTSTGEMFAHNQSYSFSNCRMTVEKESLATEKIQVTADVTNMAGLSYQVSMEKDDLTKLNGTQAYFPPQNVTAKGLTSESCTVTWSFPPSCFDRTALWVIVNGRKMAVHKDATEFSVTDLAPETQYTLYMVTDYVGDEQSDRVPFKCTTTEADSFSAGAIVGIIIGFLVITLLIVLIVIFILWKRGVIFQKEGTQANKQLHRVSRAFTQIRKTVKRGPGGAFANNAYNIDDGDDVYMYGSMAFNTRQQWQLKDSSLTLMDHVADGKFASIYKATWKHSERQEDVVAAKMLKPNFTEDDAMKMMAKINFLATKLEDHDNVIKFIGAVTDSPTWGPVLVMEYCEVGQMDKWLTQRRGQVTEQVMEDLFRFALGIAKGMEYLTSKKVIHKRLAARNVLLTSSLDTKVAGFGPQKKEGEEDEEKATRIPAKWAAPELLEEKPATEKSDVWSYGVVLWEIFSMGQVPYPTIHSNEIGTRLRSGYRMDKPEFADDTYYTLMKDCWQYKAAKRPTFGTIRAQLAKQFDSPGNRQSVGFYYDTNNLNVL